MVLEMYGGGLGMLWDVFDCGLRSVWACFRLFANGFVNVRERFRMRLGMVWDAFWSFFRDGLSCV